MICDAPVAMGDWREGRRVASRRRPWTRRPCCSRCRSERKRRAPPSTRSAPSSGAFGGLELEKSTLKIFYNDYQCNNNNIIAIPFAKGVLLVGFRALHRLRNSSSSRSSSCFIPIFLMLCISVLCINHSVKVHLCGGMRRERPDEQGQHILQHPDIGAVPHKCDQCLRPRHMRDGDKVQNSHFSVAD